MFHSARMDFRYLASRMGDVSICNRNTQAGSFVWEPSHGVSISDHALYLCTFMNKNLPYRVLCTAVAKWQALRGDLVPRIQLPTDDLTDKAKAIWQHADESLVFLAMKVSRDMCSCQ